MKEVYRTLKPGERIPTTPPNTRRSSEGYIEWTWSVGYYQRVRVYAHRVKDGVVVAGIVHHINGDRTDNRPENLEYLAQADHGRLHNPPTFNRAEAARLYAEGQSTWSLAKHYGVKTSTVWRALVSEGVTFRHPTYQLERTHCPQGHPYSGDNLIIKSNGHRRCRECQRKCSLRRYCAKRRAA